MAVYTYELEQNSSVAPARLFKAFFLDANNLIPKILLRGSMRTEIVKGDGGPGTINKVSFREGGKRSYVERRIDSIDEAGLSYCYTLIGGNAFSDEIEKIERKIQLVASPDGGCTVKIVSRYCTVGDVELEEEHIEAGKERALSLFALVEAYLKANPDSYN